MNHLIIASYEAGIAATIAGMKEKNIRREWGGRDRQGRAG